LAIPIASRGSRRWRSLSPLVARVIGDPYRLSWLMSLAHLTRSHCPQVRSAAHLRRHEAEGRGRCVAVGVDLAVHEAEGQRRCVAVDVELGVNDPLLSQLGMGPSRSPSRPPRASFGRSRAGVGGANTGASRKGCQGANTRANREGGEGEEGGEGGEARRRHVAGGAKARRAECDAGGANARANRKKGEGEEGGEAREAGEAFQADGFFHKGHPPRR